MVEVPFKRRRTKTTRSGLWRCPNLLPDLTISGPHQLWVGDITYITLESDFAYLALLTDAFSRFTVGFDLSISLAVEGCKRALAVTRELCADEEVMEQEDAYLTALETAVTYKITGDKMEMRTEEGSLVANFNRAD